jgi:hypothetical protein
MKPYERKKNDALKINPVSPQKRAKTISSKIIIIKEIARKMYCKIRVIDLRFQN